MPKRTPRPRTKKPRSEVERLREENAKLAGYVEMYRAGFVEQRLELVRWRTRMLELERRIDRARAALEPGAE